MSFQERVHSAIEIVQTFDFSECSIISPESIATIAVSRWERFERKSKLLERSSREACIEYIALGLTEKLQPSISSSDYANASYRKMAAVLCDEFNFILPAGSNCWASELNSPQIRIDGVKSLFQIARDGGLEVQEVHPYKIGAMNQSYTAYCLKGRGELWAILHMTVPIFAFTNDPPRGFYYGGLTPIVDSKLNLTPMYLASWRWLSPKWAETELNQCNMSALNDRDLKEIKRSRARYLSDALFTESD